MRNSMKILFTGGGTLGPVTPLLAVIDKWKQKDKNLEVVWIGTPHGPERDLVEEADAQFFSVPVARLPRYVSLEWIVLPYHLLMAFFRSFKILRKQKPDLIGSAGGYTAVPVIIVARLLGIPVWVHQQDVEAILTNRITAPFANLLTVAWKENLKDFPKAELVGNPVRERVLHGSQKRAHELFNLSEDKPTAFVFGGGSGAEWMNQVMSEIAVDLEMHANVIHVTGRGKMRESLQNVGGHYNAVEFLTHEMADAYAAADLVICRAGLATITELSALGKPAIVIPLPHSPQEKNAKVIENAVTVVHQDLEPEMFLEKILQLLSDPPEMQRQSNAIDDCLRTDIAGKLVEKLRSL